MANLPGADLTGIALPSIVLRRAILQGVRFQNADLESGDFSETLAGMIPGPSRKDQSFTATSSLAVVVGVAVFGRACEVLPERVDG